MGSGSDYAGESDDMGEAGTANVHLIGALNACVLLLLEVLAA